MVDGGMAVIAQGEIVQNNGIHHTVLCSQPMAQATDSQRRAEAAAAPEQPALDAPAERRGQDLPGLRAFRQGLRQMIVLIKVAMIIFHRGSKSQVQPSCL